MESGGWSPPNFSAIKERGIVQKRQLERPRIRTENKNGMKRETAPRPTYNPPASSGILTEDVADAVFLHGPVVEKSCQGTIGTLHWRCDQSMPYRCERPNGGLDSLLAWIPVDGYALPSGLVTAAGMKSLFRSSISVHKTADGTDRHKERRLEGLISWKGNEKYSSMSGFASGHASIGF